jgi:16S rRNA (guanine527-N7)-methyltransferase
MKKEQFNAILKGKINKIDIESVNEEKLDKMYQFKELLLEWNDKINLTAIVEDNEIIDKHFIDSLIINKYIKANHKMIDVGTGAGFPGIPIGIIRNDISITLLDSLNKRINFLNEIILNINLKNVKTIHSRAEDAANNNEYREKFDIAVSRAVASLPTLVEYLLPFVKEGGKCICMKGSNVEEELKSSNKAINILGGEIEKIEKIILPETDIERTIIVINKKCSTPNKYPRKAGIPTKEPII